MMRYNERWEEYYKDTQHWTKSFSRYFFRVLLQNPLAIEKEYHFQTLFSPTKIVPRSFFYFHFFRYDLICEERIYLGKIRNRDRFLQEMGTVLQTLHAYGRERKEDVLRIIPRSPFLHGEHYSPERIFEELLLEPFRSLKNKKPYLFNKVLLKNFDSITREIQALAKSVDFLPCHNSLVHGDLNESNIVVNSEDKVKIIDWAGCRWDCASCDVAQFIYLHNLNEVEKSIFLNAYNCEWITEKILRIHTLLSMGWDLIYLLYNDLRLAPKRYDRLQKIRTKIWGKKELIV